MNISRRDFMKAAGLSAAAVAGAALFTAALLRVCCLCSLTGVSVILSPEVWMRKN